MVQDNSDSETEMQIDVAMPSLDQIDSNPVAIISFAFRFPGDLKDEDSFWDALSQKRDLIDKIPADRWAINELQHNKRAEPGRSITYSAGVLSDIDQFDAGFFGISPREAAWLDPQQRILLELSWEAMENAGISPSSLAGSDCAVFVGISSLDYGTRGLDDLASLSSHLMTGNTLSIAANRLSYVFDLRGPSLAVDTACSSSLVALHYACNSLRTGEASTAFVGGVNLLLHPYPFVGFTKAAMLSANGRCKPFDASGDGYVRSEGAAVLLLKPLKRALADGDDIQAVILASGVNADGSRKTGITIPSSEGQADLMRDVLSRSGLSANDIDFIEAHGTGTAVGDPIETAAIGSVYGHSRSSPLPIGSVKANLGHLESASGMAGLIKTILALKNRALPPALHLQTPNPRIDFQALNLTTITKYCPLTNPQDKPLVAGVNSFGFGGANAHALLQEFPPRDVETSPVKEITPPPLFLSARSIDALRAMAQSYADLVRDQSAQDFYDIAYNAAFRREHLENRLALKAESVASVAELLHSYADGEAPAQVFIEDRLPESGEVAFVYSGNGSQWVGMCRALLTESELFAEFLTEIDVAMKPVAGFSLFEELHADDTNTRIDDTTVAQPLIFAIQVAVTRLLADLGIEPAAVTGYSVGEIAAAWAAGALNLEQAIQVICARSQAQALTRGKGRMVAAGLSVAAVKEAIAELGDDLDVEIAGINSPSNVTLSGSLDGLARIQELVEPRGTFFRLLDLDYAFHSREMDRIKSILAEDLDGLAPHKTEKVTFVSTVTGDALNGSFLNADYWWRNVREPVLFAKAVEKLAEIGCRVFVEIGPHAILQRYIGESLAVADIKARVIPTLRRQDDGLQRIIEATLRVHLLSVKPRLNSFFPHLGRRVRLPNYPWQRERHWHPRTSEGLLSIERRRVHPLLGWRTPDADDAWENILDPVILPWLVDHKVGTAIVYPGAAFSEMALAAAREWLGGEHFTLEQLDIVSPMVFDGEHARTLRFVLNPRDGGFQIKSRQRLSDNEWTLHAIGRVLESARRTPTASIDRPATSIRQSDRASHYRLAAMLGLDYGPAFQGLRAVRVSGDRLEASLEVPENLRSDEYLLHPALLDVCFQSLINFFSVEIEAGHGLAMLPVKIGRLELWGKGKIASFRAQLSRRGTRSVLADFELLDDDDQLVASVTKCRFRASPLHRHAERKISHWRIVPWLRPHPQDGLSTDLPPVAELVLLAQSLLGEIDHDRRAWFTETLPLIEALTLSLGYEAFQQIAQNHPPDLRQLLDSKHACWLADLLTKEGLFVQDANRYALHPKVDLPSAKALWQTILSDSPACMPQLALIGRVGQHLPELLSGKADARELLAELRRSPIVEALYIDDPAYLGVNLALEGILRHLIIGWPVSRRLRVLEIGIGPSDLAGTIVDMLPEDRVDYVIALPTDTFQALHQPDFHDHPSIIVATFDYSELKFTSDRPLPDAFDVVILRHTLHRMASLHSTLAQVRRLLALGGLMLLAERHPDWSINFLEGIDPTWWHENAEAPAAPVSSLLSPAIWRQALDDAGFGDCETFIEPAAEGLAEGAYLILAKRPLGDNLALPAPPAASWLLLTDAASAPLAEQVGSRLRKQGMMVTLSDQVTASQIQESDHLVHLLGWNDGPETATVVTARLLEDTQTLITLKGKSPRLWLVTRGGAVAPGLPTGLPPNPAQSVLWGFGRVVMNECPHLACTLIDLSCDPADPNIAARLENELFRPDGANEVVLTDGARHCLVMREDKESRLQPAPADARFRLDFHVPGQLRNLVWLPETERPLRDDEIEVRARAASLNFRDVMYLMGLLPDEAVESGFAGASLGLEFSGVVSRVGAAVKDHHPGDPVMGFGSSCFASHVITRSDAVAAMPEDWSFEAAATVPTVFLTVYYALRQLADLQPGERLLIHGAAGGVGIAAIQLARHLGAEIYATAGSEEKRDFVRLLGADHVFDSRSLDFADNILADTAGEGVDVVLNSLAGEAMRRSLDVLKPFGRFLELGKRDYFENTPVGLRYFKNNISYFGIDADQLLTGRPRLAARIFREVMALFHEQALAPLPHRTFSTGRIVDAFRVMQQARHIGKIVVSLVDAQPPIEMPAPPTAGVRFEKDSTWLVTGGLSGFGLESARWLATRGVGHLVLVGRRGLATPEAQDIIDTLDAQGVEVLVQSCDITDAHAISRLMEQVKNALPPLKGVLHAAATYDDRLIANLDAGSIDKVLSTKLLGAWYLHQATLNLPIEHFVLYSSITTAIGNPGQANYVAANAGLEGLSALRRHMGLPATCIAWGPIGDVGFLVRNEDVKESLEQRLGRAPLTAAEALGQLDPAFADEAGFVTLGNLEWSNLARLLPSATCSRFDILNRNRQDSAHAQDYQDISSLIQGKTPAEVSEIVRDLVVQEVAQILSIGADRIEPNRSLHDLGMDSLMAVELATGLEQRFGIQLPVMMLNDSPTANKVTARIVDKLISDGNRADEELSRDLVAEVAGQHGEGFTREEMQSLKSDVFRLVQTGTKLIT